MTTLAFDDEGFYRTGDALRFVDPARPDMGMVFDGRIAEDFKLRTGTWVSVGTLRAGLVAACEGLIQDVVIAGHDREYLSAILFPNLANCRVEFADLPPNAEHPAVAAHPTLRARVQRALDRLAAASTGSASRIARALVADVPPAIDAGEITDKGSLNQRAVLRERAALVADLYADPLPPHVLRADSKD